MELDIPMLFIGMDNSKINIHWNCTSRCFLAGWIMKQLKYNMELDIPTLSFEMDNSL